METLILNNGTKKDLNLLLDIAKKLGLNLTVAKRNDRYEKLRKLAQKIDNSVVENDITMEEIVEEVRWAREERTKNGN